MGNTAKQCRLGLFQDSDFTGDLEESKSTSGGTLCVFGSHTFVPISWMCKKQTAVSHSSTESEIISLDTGLRLDGLPALELRDLIVSVLGMFLVFQIDQGNLIDSLQQVISNWIMTVLGLLKSGQVGLRRTIDRGNLIKLLGMRYNKFVLIMKTLFSAEMRIPQGTERRFTMDRGNLRH